MEQKQVNLLPLVGSEASLSLAWSCEESVEEVGY